MGQDTVVSQQPLSRVLGSKSWMTTGRPALPSRATVVRGREAVTALQPALSAFSRRTGQAGAMDWLDHLLLSPTSLKKDPHVVLFCRNAGASDRIDADSLLGATLIYEYRFAGMPTGIFATDDINGTRTVLAPAPSRLEVAQHAIAQLMVRKAAIVFASVDEDAALAQEPPVLPGVALARRTRWIPTTLALGDTVDATLAPLGTRTRRNLRYYRRRAAAELGAQFVPQAQPSREEFLALNCASTHPLSQDDAIWRYELFDRSRQRGATLYAGMRSADGEWFSLIWGQRRDNALEIEWQINRADISHHSFSIAMRAFLLEHEVMMGTKQLRFIGGTQHSIRAASANRPVTDILAVRSGSVRSWALRRYAQRLLPDANFLRGALEDEAMGPTMSTATVRAGLWNF